MDLLGIPSVYAVIMIIVTLLKNTFKANDKLIKLMPIIAAGMGAVFGIVGFYLMPGMSISENVFQALMYGLLTGISTTGSIEAYTNLKNMNAKVAEVNTAVDSVLDQVQTAVETAPVPATPARTITAEVAAEQTTTLNTAADAAAPVTKTTVTKIEVEQPK